MAKAPLSDLPRILQEHESQILAEWLQLLGEVVKTGRGRITEKELQDQCREFLARLREAISDGNVDNIRAESFERLRDMLGHMSRTRAAQGFTPSETANFVFSLKQPIFELLKNGKASEGSWALSTLLDQLGLYSMEEFLKRREEVILRQQQEIAELSTPVVKLWNGILALPLIGTLDSSRTQVVMENLLQSIVQEGAEIAIIDITGVPTVDTLVAQHLLKTVAAARLMGAECIISGIRPQIAQTMVHLGVELNVASKASLADAFALALHQTGRRVTRLQGNEAQAPGAAPAGIPGQTNIGG
ncbi:STAS domain-containing protein [Dongia soli]|uniref:STAS domain-containing protein n=1 Tax=Dongia soli TaxID=600628 RepID=A0ABU5EG98_9PROT|nr:STAS domain-containing protein [Dongia soli]MDY0884616.1 STAS domain-containing protein [Dongia soli]